jgi:hypothetical protein
MKGLQRIKTQIQNLEANAEENEPKFSLFPGTTVYTK